MRWEARPGALLLIASMLFAAGELTAAPLPREEIVIVTAHGSYRVIVEVALRQDEREKGLMDRDWLAEDAGMLFLHDSPRPGDAGFWMYRTHIPLDAAFLDSQGTIVALFTMSPCLSNDPDRCPTYRPRVSYQSVLEVNGGYFAAHGVTRGDRVVRPRL